MEPDKRVLRQLARLDAIAVDDVIEFGWMEDQIEIVQNLPDDGTFAASRRSGQTDDARMSETQLIIHFWDRKVGSSHLCRRLQL